MQVRIFAICKASINRSKGTRQMVFMALLLQSETCNKNRRCLQAMHHKNEGIKDGISTTSEVHTIQGIEYKPRGALRSRPIQADKRVASCRRKNSAGNGYKWTSTTQQSIQPTKRADYRDGGVLPQVLGVEGSLHSPRRQITNRRSIQILGDRNCQLEHANICRQPRGP